MENKDIEGSYPKHDAVVKCNEAGIDLLALIPCEQFGEHRFHLDVPTTEEVHGNGIVEQVDHRGGNRTEDRLFRSREIEGFHKSIEARGRFPFGQVIDKFDQSIVT